MALLEGIKAMAWVLFEIMLAFGLAVFIVWWTLPKAQKPKPDATGDSKGKSDHKTTNKHG
ncbi:MAG: hypothetical protein JNM52_01210 [Betaproteobacteria bacterium]|nr:hypothetical protein [Betaproteobacteria bacterium]